MTAATRPDEAGKQPLLVNAHEAESDDHVPAPAVFTTTCLAKMVFAAAGAVRLESLPYFRGLDYI